jgi:dTDP-4-amino-4,6-dideoxygalactose transaminase
VGCFSFYATKNLTTGDGGMVISRNDRIARRMRLVSQQGVTAGVWRRFLSGDNAYQLVALGYRCAMNDIAASLGLVQLAGIEQRWKRRQQIWHWYDRTLRGLPLVLPQPPSHGSRHAYHLYTPLLLEEQAGITRTAFIEAMRAENIGTGVHYIPAHRQPYYRRKFRLRAADFPNATFAGDRTISLPLSPELTEEDVADVGTALTRILQHHSDRNRNAQLPVRAGARVSAAASSCSTVEQRS